MSNFKLGLYRWTYKNGTFNVAFRPNGTFYCSRYPDNALWTLTGEKLIIDWNKFGTYEFLLPAEGVTTLDGHLSGKEDNWRKMEFLREFSSQELLLLGEHGLGSVWDFQYEKGHFEVRFHCDGYNHFVCPQYPAHSHWSMTEDDDTFAILVNWGQYGEYELRVEDGALVGHKKGQPANWRRAVFLRPLTFEDVATSQHDHKHEHVHSASCNH